jgi:hypothetical protein
VNFGTEIAIFGITRKIWLKIVQKISVKGLYFKGFTFFSFLILYPGEDYNQCFLSWSAQVKRQELFSAVRGGIWNKRPVQEFYSD